VIVRVAFFVHLSIGVKIASDTTDNSILLYEIPVADRNDVATAIKERNRAQHLGFIYCSSNTNVYCCSI
jgi:hypothetical protein